MRKKGIERFISCISMHRVNWNFLQAVQTTIHTEIHLKKWTLKSIIVARKMDEKRNINAVKKLLNKMEKKKTRRKNRIDDWDD